MRKAFAIASLFITLTTVIIFIAPDIDIVGDNFFAFASLGLLTSLIFAVLSEKGMWRKAAIGSLVTVIVLFGIFVIVMRIVISGP